jgi:hypothetical protein
MIAIKVAISYLWTFLMYSESSSWALTEMPMAASVTRILNKINKLKKKYFLSILLFELYC